jgi:hypothetical protein
MCVFDAAARPWRKFRRRRASPGLALIVLLDRKRAIGGTEIAEMITLAG